jgi:hypothetical protein
MPDVSPAVEPALLPLPVRMLSHSGQVSYLAVNPVSTPESTETDPTMVGPALVHTEFGLLKGRSGFNFFYATRGTPDFQFMYISISKSVQY